jgi:DNA-binding NtrC family response regulator
MNEKPKILAVDDEHGVLESLELILGEDYELLRAMNYRDAVNTFKKHQPDLIIIDLKMPSFSGIDVLKAVKKIKPSTQTLIATGYKVMEMAQEAIKYGATDYAIKPFNIQELKEQVARLLERAKNNK